MHRATNLFKPIVAVSAIGLLTACAGTLDKLEEVGKVPEHAAVEDPTRAPHYEPMSWPAPPPKADPDKYANSLWQPGSRAFFRDQRAARVGDILKVSVKISDIAQVNNQTERRRETTDAIEGPDIFGLEDRLFRALPGKANPASLIDVESETNTRGVGTVRRQDRIETQVAALITQVLPNGNFVIYGTQEVLVNYDVREVSVRGVVRPQDIGSNNVIDSSQIAEARISYTGRGRLMDVQQPRWGSQVVDILSPF